MALLACAGVASAQHWLNAPAPQTPGDPGAFNPGSTALQLTDGTIMVQEYGSSTWWKLTPDAHADYNTGTWSKLASSIAYGATGGPEPYAPRFFASAVLPDGRVIVEGGEYEYGSGTTISESIKGAICDPVTDIWKPVYAPQGG